MGALFSGTCYLEIVLHSLTLLAARLTSLADHMAAAASPRPVTQPATVGVGPALTEDELLMASGAYNADKFNEYQRQVRTRDDFQPLQEHQQLVKKCNRVMIDDATG